MLKEANDLYEQNEVKQTKPRIDIVCVGSVFGLIGSIGYTAYNPTKYAVKGLVDCLRFEYLDKNIHMHYMAPSNMDTPGFAVENQNKPKLVADMENNVQTISADYAAHTLLCNLDNYCITTEADLEMLKNATSFMSEFDIFDYLMAPFASLGIFIYRKSIESNIMKNIDHKKD
jgi:short-subunit dehydrogenase